MRKSRFWKYLLPVAAAILVVGFAVMPRPAPPTTYHRFTSPPLPDGVRYTFLYPSTLDDVYSHSFSTRYKGKLLQLVTISHKGSPLPGGALWQNWFKPEAEFVGVHVEKATSKPLKSSRTEKQQRDNAEISHTIEIDVPQTHEHFRYWHSEDFGRTASFTQHDQVVINSFRVLLPGEPVPAP